ncbi:MAG TPA: N-acetyl-alpha-D-glucosaminyl L-malate synthase BshA, partial [Gemmatimonadaceae bacterium]
GLPEVVRDGETGVLCGVGDTDGMSKAAIHLLTNQTEWQAMSRAAAADARERFSMDDIVELYEEMYIRSLG